jgi:DhnA family fructose-bisphosphate aldolase class Ia
MFKPETFIPDSLMARLTTIRVDHPEAAFRVSEVRVRREKLAPSGRLNILAADHPARRVLKVGDDPLAMADRRGYLARIARVLMADSIDGLMATMDVIEDLLIIEGLLLEARAPSLLNGKLLIGSLNRGGLAGTAWELDDPITGLTPAACSAWRLDGAKFLLRIADDDPGSLKTMLAAAQSISECSGLRLPMFLEPLPVTRSEGAWKVAKDAASLARIAGVASALGDSSSFMWLKMPYCAGYETVARSTSLPILLLGGESAGNPAHFLGELDSALKSGSNVRGALVGRNVLYPGAEDPYAMAFAVGGLIHGGWPVEQALASIERNRGANFDALTRYL